MGYDTLTDADTATFTYPSEISGYWDYSLQISVDTVSGTEATTVTPYTSASPKSTGVWTAGTAYNPTNVGSRIDSFAGFPGRLKVVAISSGTQVTVVKVWVLLRKRYQ